MRKHGTCASVLDTASRDSATFNSIAGNSTRRLNIISSITNNQISSERLLPALNTMAKMLQLLATTTALMGLSNYRYNADHNAF